MGRIGIIPHCRGVAVPVGETVGRIEVLVSVGEWLTRQGKGLVEEQQRCRNERQRTETTENDEPNRMMLPGRRQLPKWQRQPARLLPRSAQISSCVFEKRRTRTQQRGAPECPSGFRADNRTPFTLMCSQRTIPITQIQDLGASCGCRGASIPSQRVGGSKLSEMVNDRQQSGRWTLFARGSCIRSVRGHPQHGSRRSVVGHPLSGRRDGRQVEGARPARSADTRRRYP